MCSSSGWRPPDERGAIALVAVFMAVFLVALLYYVVGIAQTVMLRERMQDAADSAALSAALMHARGMNFIVLINLVMAALLAILVTLKLAEGLATLGMLIAAGLAWTTAGATSAAIPPLKAVQGSMRNLYETTKDPVYTALEVLHATADAVAAITPGLATAGVVAEVWGGSGDGQLRGFALSSRVTEGLPVTDASFDSLCEKAGGLVGNLAMKPFEDIPGAGQLDLGSAAGSMTTALSEWFCGDRSGRAPPPSYPATFAQAYPLTAADQKCRDVKDGAVPQATTAHEATAAAKAAPAATSPDCERSSAEQLAATPDELGSCAETQDCSASGPYETRVALAREQCDPQRSPRPNQYWYQKRHGVVAYEWNGEAWQRLVPSYATPTYLKEESLPPCGPEAVSPSVAVGYNRVVRHSLDVSELEPVCSTESAPLPAIAHKPLTGERRTVEFDEVTHILGCTVQTSQSIDFGDANSGRVESDDKSPKTVATDARLGDENFQIRSVVYRAGGRGDAGRIVRLALWDRSEPDDSLKILRELGNYSIAQAEYFYDGVEGRDAWMWNMSWRARLTRFRMPLGGSSAALLGACTALDRSCIELFTALALLGGDAGH